PGGGGDPTGDARLRRRRDPRAQSAVLSHRARPGVPRHLRRSRDRPADGDRQPPHLRIGDGGGDGGDRCLGAVSRHARQLRSHHRAGTPDLRLRGRHHRRPRQLLGYAGGRRHHRRRPDRGGGDQPRVAGPGRPSGLPRRAGAAPARPVSARERVSAMDLRDLGAPELDWRRTAGGALADRARKVLGSVGVRPLAPDAVSSRRHRGEGADPIGRYRIEVATPRSRLFAVAGACLLAVLLALPAFGSRNLINELIFVFTMRALAQYWNLLAGYAGLVSVGQQAFVGLGGYLLFALTIHQGLDPLVAILTAGAITAVLAV